MIASDIDLPAGVHASTDWRQLGDITAQAFMADPFNLWMHAGHTRSMRAVFRSLARVHAQQGYCLIAGERRNGEARGGAQSGEARGGAQSGEARGGAAMWMPPGKHARLGTPAFAALALSLLMLGGATALVRTQAAGAAMAAALPAAPHMYLFTIGTLPSARGRGLGTAMLAPVLAACDRAGTPAYLENSNPANHGFYAAHGFAHRGMIEVMPGAPPLEAMWREAR